MAEQRAARTAGDGAPAAGQPLREGAPRVIVAGATGFAGALAAQLLWRHPGFELAGVTGRAETGRPLEELYPRYRVPLEVEELDVSRLQGIDAAIVANPGCYPTAAVLGLAPLARAGLLGDVVVDAKQGISGAGRVFDDTTHLSYAGENIVPYKVAEHRHTPEIEEQLALLGAKLPVQFQAHLVPLDQGELASCYVTPTREIAAAELAELYREAYRDEPFVEVAASPPGTREVCATNFCRIFAAADAHTGKVVVLSAIDNLWKGTSSQAVQNLNVMYSLPEEEGLR